VDDLLVFTKTLDLMQSMFEALFKIIKLKDLGFPSYFLGIELVQDNLSLYISQRGFIKRLLEKFEKNSLKPRQNPSISGEKLT
jgi:hypothetical protein